MRSFSLAFAVSLVLTAPLASAQTPTPEAAPSPTPARAIVRKPKKPMTAPTPAGPTADSSASPAGSGGTSKPARESTAQRKSAGKAANTPSATQAPGGGPGLVWVNTKSKAYHIQASRWYGRTKHGKYMSEADAKAAGFHPAPGKD